MIRHQAVDMDLRPVSGRRRLQVRQKLLPVLSTPKDLLALVSPGRHMVESPRVLDTKRPSHLRSSVQTLVCSPATDSRRSYHDSVKCVGLTPISHVTPISHDAI